MLIDDILHDSGYAFSFLGKEPQNLILNRLRSAERFVFDDNAIAHTAMVIDRVPDLLVKQQAFARAPFDVVWIEFDYEPLFKTISGNIDTDWDPEGDKRLGYLVDHERVYICSGGDDGKSAVLPIAVDLHTAWKSTEERRQIEKTYGIDMAKLMLGSSFKAVSSETKCDIVEHNSLAFLPFAPRYAAHRERIQRRCMEECHGDVRNILAILLLLNRPSVTQYAERVPRGRRFVRGKLRTFMDYSRITIDLDPVPALVALSDSGNGRAPDDERRRHRVSGTWCHNADARRGSRIGCIHSWAGDEKWIEVDDPADPDHWVCGVCGGKRWWREAHDRGNAAKGFVSHYVHDVTAGAGDGKR